MKTIILTAVVALVAGSAIAQPAGGPGMMGPGMMRMMLIVMDTDGDGALSLEEMQAVHTRVFAAMDANKDGRVTTEEMGAFMHGEGEAPSAQ